MHAAALSDFMIYIYIYTAYLYTALCYSLALTAATTGTQKIVTLLMAIAAVLIKQLIPYLKHQLQRPMVYR
jgi:hypothetical protein